MMAHPTERRYINDPVLTLTLVVTAQASVRGGDVVHSPCIPVESTHKLRRCLETPREVVKFFELLTGYH